MFQVTAKSAKSTVLCARRFATNAAPSRKRVVFVDGCRIPFQPAGTIYDDFMSHDLGRHAIKGLLTRTAIDSKALDYVIMGTVIQEVRTSNLARECALGAGISDRVPAHTVTMACISANQAIATGACMILAGQADTVIAGGAETFSDVPIRHSRKMRKLLLKLNKARTMQQRLSLLQQIRIGHLMPETPPIAEFSTNEVMGHSSDRLAARFGISRADQDAFALRSHSNAQKAHDSGLYKDEVVAFNGETAETGIRVGTIEKLNSLKPAFVKPFGTHTAANSSYLTDGAAAVLVMSEDKAKALSYQPRSVLKDWTFVAQDPKDQLLLGPAYGIAAILKKNGLTLADIDVFEMHEAFAGQVLANLAALQSDSFCKEFIGLDKAIGEIPMDKLNTLGGSLSIGHPFGATGARLVTTATNRLHREDGKLALVAACAAGGQGHCMLIERV